MKTILLQIQNNDDYELFLSIAKRLNCRIIPTENWSEIEKEDILFSSEMILELEKRLSQMENNPHESFTMEDVKKELEGKFGRKIQTSKAG